ncbi:RNA polymerase sigma-70 factor [Mucilaginibacter phyllosphaerae]
MTNYKKLSETELTELLQQDSLGAFREIYVRYWKALYGEAYKRLKDKDQCEEIVQELFAGLWNKRMALQIDGTLGGYLYKSVGYRVIDQYRREMVRAKHRELFKAVYSEADHSTENAIMLKDLEHSINLAVGQLPDKCRSVYELSRVEHKTNKEIAEYLGISEKTVENHLTRALKKLRVSLGNYYGLLLFLLIK